MNLDSGGLEVLARAECLRLLTTTTKGRIAFHSGALPVILPVSYRCDEQGIVIRVREGSQLAAATDEAVVAFEAGDGDPNQGDGWSVTVTGVASVVVEEGDVDALRGLGFDGWRARGPADRFVRISTELVSGCRGIGAPNLAVSP